MMDRYSPRQLCALLAAALAAPLVTVCSAVTWPWVLLGAAVAAIPLFYIYRSMGPTALPQGLGPAELLTTAWGKMLGKWLALASWLWLVLTAALTASMAVTAFPRDNAFPLIPMLLLILAAVASSQGAAATCRFGATLFLAVAPMISLVLAFGTTDVELRALRPDGTAMESLGPLTVLLIPAAAFYLRDGLTQRKTAWFRWYLLIAGAGVAVSLVCVGALGLPLAQASSNAFWLMSRSISVLGVMERFEVVISALLSISFCCLLAFLLAAARQALTCAAPNAPAHKTVWGGAALAAAFLWLVPSVPNWGWIVGNLAVLAIVPATTLFLVELKKS